MAGVGELPLASSQIGLKQLRSCLQHRQCSQVRRGGCLMRRMAENIEKRGYNVVIEIYKY